MSLATSILLHLGQGLRRKADAEQTSTQNAEFHHDINILNTLFGTPTLYS